MVHAATDSNSNLKSEIGFSPCPNPATSCGCPTSPRASSWARSRSRRLKGVDLQDRPRRVHLHHGPLRLGQDHPLQHDRRAGQAHRRQGLHRRGRHRPARRLRAGLAALPQDRLHLPDLQPHPGHDRPGERHAADDLRRHDHRRRRARRAWSCSSRSAWATASTTSPSSCPAASSSAWPSPARWPTTPPSSWPTSPPATSTCTTGKEIIDAAQAA